MSLSDATIREIVATGGSLIDELYTTPEERMESERKFIEALQAMDLAQMEVNKQEAQNPNWFVSAWRPAVGWVCVGGFAWHAILLPVMNSLLIYYTHFTGQSIDTSALPTMEMATIMPVLLGMLGMGSFRTFEKTRGVARS